MTKRLLMMSRAPTPTDRLKCCKKVILYAAAREVVKILLSRLPSINTGVILPMSANMSKPLGCSDVILLALRI